MKLRNKKTGEVINTNCKMYFTYINGERARSSSYDTLAELNEEWEDTEDSSVTPLIKDEETRKVVRAWAKVNKIKCVTAYNISEFDAKWCLSERHWRNSIDTDIDFLGYLPRELNDKESYTIDELCGEEG